MGVLPDLTERRTASYENIAQQKQRDQIRANTLRFKEVRATYAVGEHEPDRLNT
jgi:hypothetical protein